MRLLNKNGEFVLYSEDTREDIVQTVSTYTHTYTKTQKLKTCIQKFKNRDTTKCAKRPTGKHAKIHTKTETHNFDACRCNTCTKTFLHTLVCTQKYIIIYRRRHKTHTQIHISSFLPRQSRLYSDLCFHKNGLKPIKFLPKIVYKMQV